MVLTYYGKACVKVGQGDTTIAFNPTAKEAKGASDKYPRFGADVVLISRNEPLYNAAENMEYAEKKPFVIDGPGEYEVGGVYISGFGVEHEGKWNTIYVLTIDDIRVCHLGALASATLPADVIEQLGEVHMVFAPVWGEGVLSPAEAHKVSMGLEPSIIIPLHDGVTGPGSPLETFLKEAGAEKTEMIDKLTIKKKDLEGKEAEIVLLESVL